MLLEKSFMLINLKFFNLKIFFYLNILFLILFLFIGMDYLTFKMKILSIELRFYYHKLPDLNHTL